MSEQEQRPRRRRWKAILGVVLVVIVAVVLLLPTLASHFIAPGMIRTAIAREVEGTVAVSGISFSWFGSQQVGGITITSPDGTTSIDGSARIERSLLGLLFGWPDIGRVDLTVSGKGTMQEDGTTSFASLLRVPDSQEENRSTGTDDGTSTASDGVTAAVHLAVPSLDLVVAGSEQSLRISEVEATVDIATGEPLDTSFKASVLADGTTGTVTGSFTLGQGPDGSGTLRLAESSLDGSLTAENLRLPAGGAWVDIERLHLAAKSSALGKGLALTGDARGTFQDSSPLSMQADIELGSLIGPEGTVSLGPDAISGSLDAKSIPSSLLQPFLVGMPVTLVRDIGPELNLTLQAAPGATRTVQLGLAAERMHADATLTLGERSIANATVTIDGRLDGALLEEFGLASQGDVELKIVGSNLAIDLADDGAPELTSLAGTFDLTTKGSILLPVDEARIPLADLHATLSTRKLDSGLEVDLTGTAMGAPLKVTGSVSNLFIDRTFSAANPAMKGRVSIDALDPAALEPLFGDALAEKQLAEVTSGAVTIEANGVLVGGVLDADATIGSPRINGTAKVVLRGTDLDVPSATASIRVDKAILASFVPQLDEIGTIAGPMTAQLRARDLAYRMGDSDASPLSRLKGVIQAEIARASVQLVDPAERILLESVACDLTLAGGKPMQVEGSADVSVEAGPIGKLSVATKGDTITASMDSVDVPRALALAGSNPAPFVVALGEQANLEIEVPVEAAADGSRACRGSITSSHGSGSFQATIGAEQVSSLTAKFDAELQPDTLKQALGPDSVVRLVNTVPVSLQVDASDLPFSGGVRPTTQGRLAFTVQSMQIVGEDDAVVQVRGITGTGTVRGSALQANVDASVLDSSTSGGKGKARLRTSATLPMNDKPFTIGETELELDSVPTLVLELVGSDGRIAEAALGRVVDAHATITAAREGRSRVTARLSSPYATFEMPQAWLEDSMLSIPAENVATGTLQVSPELGQELLSVVHPIFADIASTDHPFKLTLGPLQLPLEGDQAAKLNGRARLEIGTVTLRSTDFGAGILQLLGNAGGTSVPADFSPLNIVATNGMVKYSDFIARIGKDKAGRFKQELDFKGKINLAADPPTVIGISAAFPASNLASIFRELRNVPPALLGTLRPKVTFYGPLYDASGKRIALKSKIDPLSLDDGLKPDQIEGIIKGIGDLIRNRN